MVVNSLLELLLSPILAHAPPVQDGEEGVDGRNLPTASGAEQSKDGLLSLLPVVGLIIVVEQLSFLSPAKKL
jgi:hypothetical protein